MDSMDDAKRAADAVNKAWSEGKCGQWIAIRMWDGSTDGIVYAEKASAIEHQLHESMCCYVRIPIGGITVDEMARFLTVNRVFYDKGFRISDPQDQREPIMPHTREEYIHLLNTTRR